METLKIFNQLVFTDLEFANILNLFIPSVLIPIIRGYTLFTSISMYLEPSPMGWTMYTFLDKNLWSLTSWWDVIENRHIQLFGNWLSQQFPFVLSYTVIAEIEFEIVEESRNPQMKAYQLHSKASLNWIQELKKNLKTFTPLRNKLSIGFINWSDTVFEYFTTYPDFNILKAKWGLFGGNGEDLILIPNRTAQNIPIWLLISEAYIK